MGNAGIPVADSFRYLAKLIQYCKFKNKIKLIKKKKKVKMESEKIGLTLNIQKTKIMASGPITSWQTDGETVG